MIAKRREDRYTTASELFDDLELLRMDERALAGEAEAGRSTIIHALQRGRLRVVGLLEEKISLQQQVDKLRILLTASLVGLGLLGVAFVALLVRYLSIR